MKSWNTIEKCAQCKEYVMLQYSTFYTCYMYYLISIDPLLIWSKFIYFYL